jgi:hypothetical protein
MALDTVLDSCMACAFMMGPCFRLAQCTASLMSCDLDRVRQVDRTTLLFIKQVDY